MASVILDLDKEALEMILIYEHYQDDSSYAIQLAAKILELYRKQTGGDDNAAKDEEL